ncbi:MAG TPA: hypothetical protein VMW17_22555 [Candidatus Binatia bacterium]|nr:hypothetical protein [Candidatus Binatia bacterium]
MAALQLVPVVLSLLVLAAHFLRGGSPILIVVLAILALVGVRRAWAARVIQASLIVGALEWCRTLFELAVERAHNRQPAGRLVVILGSVALVTLLSSLLFQTRTLRRVYRLDGKPGVD